MPPIRCPHRVPYEPRARPWRPVGSHFSAPPPRSCNCANSPCRCTRTRIGEKRPHMKSARQRKKVVRSPALCCPAEHGPKPTGIFSLLFPFFRLIFLFCLPLLNRTERQRGERLCLVSLFFLIEKSTESAKKKRIMPPRAICVSRLGGGDRLFSLAWPLGEPRNLTCRSQFALCPFFCL